MTPGYDERGGLYALLPASTFAAPAKEAATMAFATPTAMAFETALATPTAMAFEMTLAMPSAFRVESASELRAVEAVSLMVVLDVEAPISGVRSDMDAIAGLEAWRSPPQGAAVPDKGGAIPRLRPSRGEEEVHGGGRRGKSTQVIDLTGLTPLEAIAVGEFIRQGLGARVVRLGLAEGEDDRVGTFLVAGGSILVDISGQQEEVLLLLRGHTDGLREEACGIGLGMFFLQRRQVDQVHFVFKTLHPPLLIVCVSRLGVPQRLLYGSQFDLRGCRGLRICRG